MNKKQIVVIVIVVAVMGFLFKQPVKGLVKPKASEGHTNAVATEKRPIANVTVEMVSAMGKIAIGPALAGQINDLESKLKNAESGNVQPQRVLRLAGPKRGSRWQPK